MLDPGVPPVTSLSKLLPSQAPADVLQVVVNARHLTGPRTGIEVYMEQLLAALSRTGAVEVTALSWGPLDLHLPRIRELIPARRPELTGIRATLWKLWFDQWHALRAVSTEAPVLVHGMEQELANAAV